MIGEINDFSINTSGYYQVLLNFSEIVFVKPERQKQDQKRLLFGPWKVYFEILPYKILAQYYPRKHQDMLDQETFSEHLSTKDNILIFKKLVL